jgi:hypothetical protein
LGFWRIWTEYAFTRTLNRKTDYSHGDILQD